MVEKQEPSTVLVPGLVGFFGANGTIKTSEAIRWPHKVAVMDLELGSGRAWEIREFTKTGLVEVHEFPLPVKDMSKRFSKLVGQRELWAKLLNQINQAMETPEIRAVVIDTGTALWQLIRDSYLQELQEADLRQGKKEIDIRKQLLQIEHGDGEPNRRMDHIVQLAKVYKKWVIVIHHDTDEYVPVTIQGIPQLNPDGTLKTTPSGRRIADGWKRTGPALDWQFESVVLDTPEGPVPTFTIREKTAGGIFLRNHEFQLTPGKGEMSLFRMLERVNGSELTKDELARAQTKAEAEVAANGG